MQHQLEVSVDAALRANAWALLALVLWRAVGPAARITVGRRHGYAAAGAPAWGGRTEGTEDTEPPAGAASHPHAIFRRCRDGLARQRPPVLESGNPW